MERLLEQIGLTYLSVLAVVFYLGKKSAFAIGLAALGLFVVFLLIKKYRNTIYLPAMACVALLACVVNIIYTDLSYERTVSTYDEKNAVVTATLYEEPYKSNGVYSYYFKAKEVDNEKASFKFVSYHDELLDIEPFDTVMLNVRLRKNDYSNDLSKKCFLIGDLGYETPIINVIKSEKTPYYYAIKLRQSIRTKLSAVLSKDTFPLCSALLIGDKYLLSDEIHEDFRRAGVSHVIVVSGMHLSILVSLFLMLSQKHYRYQKIYLSVAVVFIILYMAVTGFTPSVVRSSVMLLVYCLGILISRDPYPLNSLGLASIIVTVTNPYSVGNVGLILSFASTFAILKFSPYLETKCFNRIKPLKTKNLPVFKRSLCVCINKGISGVISVLCMNISAALVSIPLSIVFFGSLSGVSVLSTLILYLPIQCLLILTFFLALLCFIPFLSFLVPAVCFCVEVFAKISLFIVKFFSELPFSYIYVKHNFVYLWVLMCFIMLLLTLYSKSKKRVRVFALSCVLVFFSGYVSATLLTYEQSSLYVYDVENGTAVLYSDNDVNAVLSVDCNKNNTNRLISDIQKTVSNIDFCACVSDTENGANSVSALSKSFAISEVLLYDTKSTVDFSEATENVTVLSGDMTVNLSDDVTAYYFMAQESYVTFLESKNSSVLILPKYIDVADIKEEYRSADVVIVNNCPNNFELLNCKTLIISAGSEYAYNTMKCMYSICDRVLLTALSDIEIKMGV